MKYYLKTKNDCLKTQIIHPLNFLKKHLFIMDFLKTLFFHRPFFQKAEPLTLKTIMTRDIK